jgi:hypothetical protein
MIVVISILLLARGSAIAGETPDAETIIQRFIARAKAAAEIEARQMISYQRRTRIEELGDDDSVKETRSKEYAVTNRAGLVQTVLIKVNDRPPSDDEMKSDRRTESDARRESGRRRRGPDFLDEALVRRFEYTLEGEETIEGRRVFRLAYQPTRTTTAGKDVDRILGLLHGQIWIDAEEYEMVKVEARLRSALRLLGGIAGALNRLEFAIVRRPIEPGHWANVLLTTRAEGRKLLSSFRARVQVDQEAFRIEPITAAAP